MLVETKLDDLPPNVLLMRILEGMRNAVPKKRLSAGGSLRVGTVPPPALTPVMAPTHPPPEPNARLLPHTAALLKVRLQSTVAKGDLSLVWLLFDSGRRVLWVESKATKIVQIRIVVMWYCSHFKVLFIKLKK